jgi:hypothetical protein
MGKLIDFFKNTSEKVDGHKSNYILLAILVLVVVTGSTDVVNGFDPGENFDDGDLLKVLLVGLGGAFRSALGKIGKS